MSKNHNFDNFLDGQNQGGTPLIYPLISGDDVRKSELSEQHCYRTWVEDGADPYAASAGTAWETQEALFARC